MNITISREALLKPLQAISGIVEKKQTLPLLANVLLTIKDGHLLLTGTDLEIELIGSVQVHAQTTEGTTTVSARKLFDICRTLPENSVLSLSLEKNHLVVRASESCFMLNTLPPQDFPNLDHHDYAINFPIKQHLLKTLLTKTYFAMGQQDVRHYLNGTFIDINEHSIKCVATDGHRLALATTQVENLTGVITQVILPRKSVLELIRLLTDNDDEAMIHLGDHRFRITTPDYAFTSKLISAQYPDYNRLIPKGTTAATGNRELIKQALTRASILSNEKFRGVRFQLDTDKLLITANNADQEQAEEAVSIDYAGNKMEIGFNVAYLLDVVSSMTTKMIRCAFLGPNDGVLIEPAEDDALYTTTYVVMPMRL